MESNGNGIVKGGEDSHRLQTTNLRKKMTKIFKIRKPWGNSFKVKPVNTISLQLMGQAADNSGKANLTTLVISFVLFFLMSYLNA